MPTWMLAFSANDIAVNSDVEIMKDEYMHTDRIALPGEPDTLSCEANTAQMTMHARIVPASARAQPAAIVGPKGSASLSLRVSCALIDSSMPNEQKATVDTAVAVK